MDVYLAQRSLAQLQTIGCSFVSKTLRFAEPWLQGQVKRSAIPLSPTSPRGWPTLVLLPFSLSRNRPGKRFAVGPKKPATTRGLGDPSPWKVPLGARQTIGISWQPHDPAQFARALNFSKWDAAMAES